MPERTSATGNTGRPLGRQLVANSFAHPRSAPTERPVRGSIAGPRQSCRDDNGGVAVSGYSLARSARAAGADSSMEAMGIEVFTTAQNAGVPFASHVTEKIVWNGLVLFGTASPSRPVVPLAPLIAEMLVSLPQRRQSGYCQPPRMHVTLKRRLVTTNPPSNESVSDRVWNGVLCAPIPSQIAKSMILPSDLIAESVSWIPDTLTPTMLRPVATQSMAQLSPCCPITHWYSTRDG